MGATMTVARPADAAGEAYDWVATNDGSTHVASDPANWVRESDGQHGVPGALETARGGSPVTALAVDTTWPAAELDVVGAVSDGVDDLRTTSTARLTATSASLNGDSDLDNGAQT